MSEWAWFWISFTLSVACIAGCAINQDRLNAQVEKVYIEKGYVKDYFGVWKKP